MRAVMGTEGLPGPLLCLHSPQKGDSPLQTSMTNERTPQLPRLRAGTEPETERKPCPAVLLPGTRPAYSPRRAPWRCHGCHHTPCHLSQAVLKESE